jgi:predicted acylesterase/phospholipase RssA
MPNAEAVAPDPGPDQEPAWLASVRAPRRRLWLEFARQAFLLTALVIAPLALLVLAAGVAVLYSVLGFVATWCVRGFDAAWAVAAAGAVWALCAALAIPLAYVACATLYRVVWVAFGRFIHRRYPIDAGPPIERDAAACLVVRAADGDGAMQSPPLEPWRLCDGSAAEDEPPPYPWVRQFEFRRIGIVLAGGGAKGVYQAGALQAVHDFLAERRALGAVRAIAGTSIGSWNALFWLGGLVHRDGSAHSGLRTWWTGYTPKRLVRPIVRTVPGVRAQLLSNDPWQREFEVLFGRAGAPGHAALARQLATAAPAPGEPLHFYLSRTNVLPGRLAFDTNNQAAVDSTNRWTHDMDRGRLATSIDKVREAVFTSMAIPPLFPYANVADARGSEWAEDGGVTDNLPIRLAAAFDRCDLLVILPLNASFQVDERPHWMGTRLTRVIDVRQGVLERLALKQVYLFNISYAARRSRLPVPALVIAPGQPTQVRTTELWRSGALRGAVFDQMYAATRQALAAFFEPTALHAYYRAFQPKWSPGPAAPLGEGGYLRMNIVDPGWAPGTPFEQELRF